MRTFQEHANNVDIHVTLEEKNIFSDKYTKAEIDNKFSAFETNIDWKEAVDTYTDILEMYPKPQDGWTVNVKDTDYTYRFNGTDWVAISSNSIPNATSELNGLMTKEQAAVLNKLDNAVGSLQNLTTVEKQNLVGAVNEVKSQVTQLNSDLDNIATEVKTVNNTFGYGTFSNGYVSIGKTVCVSFQVLLATNIAAGKVLCSGLPKPLSELAIINVYDSSASTYSRAKVTYDGAVYVETTHNSGASLLINGSYVAK